MSYVLIVDDEASFRGMLQTTVSGAGYDARGVESGEAAVEAVQQEKPGLVFLDLRMGSKAMDGLGTFEALRKIDPDIVVVFVTAFGDVQTAVAAMKAGALDFLEKPIDLGEVREILGRVLQPATGTDTGKGRERLPFGGITPAEGPMQAALELLAAAAGSDVPVLITGESGTGKELAAEFVHRESERSGGPFVKVNCAAFPGGLLETEMFGCKAGAYTGAEADRAGRFEAAQGGTLLLDEIGEMDVGLQAKLLRVLQEKEFERVGETKVRKADVRVIASTNRPTADSLKEGKFREDLYYRLNVFEVILPPLRERVEDILPLSRYFVRSFSSDRPRRLAPETEQLLVGYGWPGNVRELKNGMERAVILARGGVIRPDHLPSNVRSGEGAEDDDGCGFRLRPGASVHEMEKELIVKTLAVHEGNRTRTAEALGMSRRALLYKIKRYGLSE